MAPATELEKLHEEFTRLRRENDTAQARLREAEQQLELIRAKYDETAARKMPDAGCAGLISAMANLRIIIDDCNKLIAANQSKIERLGSELTKRLYDEAHVKPPSTKQS